MKMTTAERAIYEANLAAQGEELLDVIAKHVEKTGTLDPNVQLGLALRFMVYTMIDTGITADEVLTIARDQLPGMHAQIAAALKPTAN